MPRKSTVIDRGIKQEGGEVRVSKVYCKNCKKREDIPPFFHDDYDGCSVKIDDWYSPDHETSERCSVRNKDNDCPHFEPKKIG